MDFTNNHLILKKYRSIRNKLLKQTDKYFLIDYPIDYNKQLIIKAYRQELRDFINNNEIKILAGEFIYFPEYPDFLTELNILYGNI